LLIQSARIAISQQHIEREGIWQITMLPPQLTIRLLLLLLLQQLSLRTEREHVPIKR
jgi:hypothetical protein